MTFSRGYWYKVITWWLRRSSNVLNTPALSSHSTIWIIVLLHELTASLQSSLLYFSIPEVLYWILQKGEPVTYDGTVRQRGGGGLMTQSWHTRGRRTLYFELEEPKEARCLAPSRFTFQTSTRKTKKSGCRIRQRTPPALYSYWSQRQIYPPPSAAFWRSAGCRSQSTDRGEPLLAASPAGWIRTHLPSLLTEDSVFTHILTRVLSPPPLISGEFHRVQSAHMLILCFNINKKRWILCVKSVLTHHTSSFHVEYFAAYVQTGL